MLVSLYLLTIIYTNTMGLIIIKKCSPFINKEIESKGYSKKELSDSELLSEIFKSIVLFFIPGYYLKKAVDLTSDEVDLDRLISKKVESGEMIKTTNGSEEELDVPKVDSIFKKQPKLSLGEYDIPKHRALNNNTRSMYTDMRLPNRDDVDMAFWDEEEVSDLEPVLEQGEDNIVEIRRGPAQEYLDSISDEELEAMFRQLETIRKLKKDSENFLNGKAA